MISPLLLRRLLGDPHFFQNCGSFQYNISYERNDRTLERHLEKTKYPLFTINSGKVKTYVSSNTLSGTYFKDLFAQNPLVACPQRYQQYSSQLREHRKRGSWCHNFNVLCILFWQLNCLLGQRRDKEHIR